MLKYGMWANPDDELVRKISEAVEATNRPFQPAIDFGPSVCLILYADRKRVKQKRTILLGAKSSLGYLYKPSSPKISKISQF